MRWAGQNIDSDECGALPGLGRLDGLIRSVTTPEFDGVTFHEVAAKSALNRVPGGSRMPFGWTVNPYRGCTHACVYCYARGSHEWLDLDAGRDFDSQIVVKTNVSDVLRSELARRSWSRELVALGTNTDPYQRAEGRYRLMPGIIEALVDARTPFSILTKGTLLRRDLPLLVEAARTVPVGVGVSIAIGDPQLHDLVEPGTPSPRARLALVRALADAGLRCGVMIAPVLPWVTDSRAALERLIGDIADAGGAGATVLPLHLRHGAREWYFAWLERHRPGLVGRYRALYGGDAYVPEWYEQRLRARVVPILRRYGLESAYGMRGLDEDDRAAAVASPPREPEPTLF
ncbi:Rv2578c family radical SAM protein [Solicola gregarius]|uniref:Rv2578c family radical SAM protein n=1 Tax=Solicola gregarius TaxID=2908642 RepID=A0AA46YKM1_9ACTN|nr:Rv2578c family radical SAM protein [Solicola gregarius]UYM04724.1 Rv2578c family radical SAM protein [Solicola gregarius]